MRPILLCETLFLLGAAVVDIHDIHRAIADVGQHIHPTKVPQVVRHSGKALGENIRANEINVIIYAPEIEVRAVLLQQVALSAH